MTTTGLQGAPTGRVYAGATADQRRAERRTRLIAAGLETFGTKGVAATRVDDVCAASGLTKRYFYEGFSSLEALLDAVIDHVILELAKTVVPAVAEHGWVNPRPALEAYLRPILADPRLVQLLVVEANNGALAQRRQELVEYMIDTWLKSDPYADPGPEYLATQRLLAHAMAGATGEIALAWVNGRLDLTVDQVIDHIVRIFDRITPRR